MKILQVCPKFHHSVASGSTKVAYCISKKLAERGHKIIVYTSNMLDKYNKITKNDKVDYVDGIKVYRFRAIAPIATREMKIFLTPSIIKILKKEIGSFDVVHLHEYHSFQNIVTYYFCKKYNVRYVLHLHGGLSESSSWRILKKLYDALFGRKLLFDASKIIALSPIEARQCRVFGIPEEKVVIIPNGIDLLEDYNINLVLKGRFKEKFQIEKKNQIILYVGRINPLKGLDFLVNGFAYLVKNLKYDDAVLVIAGQDEGYLKNIRKLVKKHKIDNKVLFVGPLFGMEKIDAYTDASVVASLDSLSEIVFLLVPLEAVACGTPVIVTKSNYIAQLAEQEGFGFSVDYGDVPKLALTLKEILNDERLRKEIGLKGRNFVYKNFKWDNIIKKVEETYESVCYSQIMRLDQKQR